MRAKWTAETRLQFHCPGCNSFHEVAVLKSGEKQDHVWGWNCSLALPTFEPSIQVTWGGTSRMCHSFVRDGQIQFLDDCTHQLRGKTVPLPELE
jgi:hypothetical protein